MKEDRPLAPDWVCAALPKTFVIAGQPTVKKNNKRIIINKATGKPMIISSDCACAWEKRAIAVIRGQWGYHTIPAGVWLNACIRSYLARAQRPDASNLYEAPQDALQGAGVISNDYWIVSHDGSRRLRDPDYPRVEITLSVVPSP